MHDQAFQTLRSNLPQSGRVMIQGCSSESRLFHDALIQGGDQFGALTMTGIQIPGVNERAWIPNGTARFETFFMTPQLSKLRPQVRFLPLCYNDILNHLKSVPIEAAVFSVSPPDSEGMCSFGPTVDFLAELWPQIPVRIAHINPLLPRTLGPTGIPFASLTASVEAPEVPILVADPEPDSVTLAIAAQVSAFVADGSTLQMGVGKLPGAILQMIGDRKALRIHSGLIGDQVLDLLKVGAISCGAHVTAGVAIGSQRLYDSLTESGFEFQPVSYTHAPSVIAGLNNFVAINSAAAVDLFGQAYSEVIRGSWSSGSGGATDFARGARAGGGLRIVALPSSAGSRSRIIPAGSGEGPVTLGRTDIDIIATEFGVADLRDLDFSQRAAALIAIAAPEHQESLARSWRDGPACF